MQQSPKIRKHVVDMRRIIRFNLTRSFPGTQRLQLRGSLLDLGTKGEVRLRKHEKLRETKALKAKNKGFGSQVFQVWIYPTCPFSIHWFQEAFCQENVQKSEVLLVRDGIDLGTRPSRPCLIQASPDSCGLNHWAACCERPLTFHLSLLCNFDKDETVTVTVVTAVVILITAKNRTAFRDEAAKPWSFLSALLTACRAASSASRAAMAPRRALTQPQFPIGANIARLALLVQPYVQVE